MPYVRCSMCGVFSYGPRQAHQATCPECGVPLAQAAEGTSRSADRITRLDQLLRMTRGLLDVDVALLTQICDGREVARRAYGDWPGGAFFENASLPLEETFCQRMLDGRIGNYIRDTWADPRVNDLAMARQLGIRAWLGVPIKVSDMRLYVLCCLAVESRPSIGAREVRLLLGLAESVRVGL